MAETVPAPAPVVEPYATTAQQHEAATLGMWIFLATEILFFGALFTAYAVYRHWFGQGFAAAGSHTDIMLGSINTAVLLTSSAVMALAVESAKAGAWRGATALLGVTALLGLVFLAIKISEWHSEYTEHLLPGAHFSPDLQSIPGTSLFFTLYFAMTGVHALHLLIGIIFTTTLAIRCKRGNIRPALVEMGGLYWHFIDVVWIFLFPLLYLNGRAG